MLATLFVTGSPPFSLFFSEMMILRAGFLGAHPVATAVFLVALVILFCGFAYQIGRLVLGGQTAAADRAVPVDREVLDWGAMVTLVAALVAVVELPSVRVIPESTTTGVDATLSPDTNDVVPPVAVSVGGEEGAR